MTTSEAVKIITEKRDYCQKFIDLAANGKADYPGTVKYCEALDIALDALRAQQEREEQEPCEFCGEREDAKNLYSKDGYNFYAGFYKQLKVDEFDEYETNDIKFCPVCGRPLKGESNGTLHNETT